MTTDTSARAWWKTMLRRQWPWLVLASLLIPAVWHVVDFEEDVDPEFPRVERPTFSRLPPSAYRLAEPGDTLDRIELYLAAAGVVLAAGGLAARRERGLWPAGLAIALAGLWYSATPGPAVDGWYGLGWRTILDGRAPTVLRAELLAAAVALAAIVARSVFVGSLLAGFGSRRGAPPCPPCEPVERETPPDPPFVRGGLETGEPADAETPPGPPFVRGGSERPPLSPPYEGGARGGRGPTRAGGFEGTRGPGPVPTPTTAGRLSVHRPWRRGLGDAWNASRIRGSGRLWIAALVLAVARQFELPGVEPAGYWPRWAMIGALLAFDLGLMIELVPRLPSRSWRWAVGVLAVPVWIGLVAFGIAVTWYHRPLARLKVVVPDRIYISAMPTPRGLEIAQSAGTSARSSTSSPRIPPFRSPFHEDELKFAREHGIRYVGSPSDPSPEASDAFLTQTLALAQDPSAWPILVHCHGCMDRSPAWMGIYRFVVAGTAAAGGHAGDRAASGLPAQGVGDAALQPGAGSPGARALPD